ncbi:hypothetical protein EJ419_01155 [Alloscardovia theropitheci]|uniref:Uncharacterized protein n=1 Tax=Alloscardovia theropitheci TaxID=2496842 RepID=A0A4R0QYL3_9BIFI|nr:hypothetical protein [Alloscardovia theropitheci]TCD54741.1 hypothetical protein EJ419_01155 [Alloscardovia theropitheci]
MANRAERRAQAKRQRRGQAEPQPGTTRSREGLLDEQSLQERSVRLQNKSKGAWVPTSSTLQAEDDSDVIPSADPKVRAASNEQRATKKERKLRERAMKELLREEKEREKEAGRSAFARSPRWWGSLCAWVVAGISLIAAIAFFVTNHHARGAASIVVFVIALIALAIIARTEPENEIEELARQDRMDDIRQAQNAGQRKAQAHSLSWWVRVLNWILIVVSALAFMSLLFWTASVWVIMGIAIAFGVGVLNLFIVARPSDENPHLDQYGTAL